MGHPCPPPLDSRLLGNDGWGGDRTPRPPLDPSTLLRVSGPACLVIALPQAAGGSAGDVVGGVDEEGEGGEEVVVAF